MYKLMSNEEKEKRKQERKQQKYNKEHKEIDGVKYKLCNQHHIYFPDESPWISATIEYFYDNKTNTIDHLHPECKKCSIQKARIYQINHLEESYASHEKYRKTVKYQKWNRKHKEENEEFLIEYRKTDKFKQSMKRNYEFRKLHKQHDISKEEWETCKQYFNYKCAYCGLPIEEHYRIYAGNPQKIDFHKDHYDNEGVNDLSNCIPSCGRCNGSKKGKRFEDWYPELSGAFSEERLDKIIKWITEDYKLYITK